MVIKKTENYLLLIYWPSHMYQISDTGSHKRFQAPKTVTDLVTFKHYLSFLVQIILLRRCTNATNIQMLHEMIKKRERNGNKKKLKMICCLYIGLRASCIRFLAQEVTSAFRHPRPLQTW